MSAALRGSSTGHHAVFPSEATTPDRPMAAEYSPWRAPPRLANRLANVPPFPRHTGAQPQHRRNWAAIAMFRHRHIRAAASRYNVLTVGNCCGDSLRLCVAFSLPFGGNRRRADGGATRAALAYVLGLSDGFIGRIPCLLVRELR
eukprot:scaffold25556_cov70-Phaeocystis_antarctica.AAC.9